MPVTQKKTAAALTLDIVKVAGPWRGYKKLTAALAPALPVIMARHALPPGDYEIAVALTDDAHQAELNHQFRGLAQATNVLSFPQYDRKALGRLKPGPEPVFLGDISLAYQYMVDEARRDRKMLQDHIIHLVIHGILHILGHDHGTSRQALAMEQMEREILAVLDIADPYGADPYGALARPQA